MNAFSSFNLATEDMNKRLFHELEFQCMTMLLRQNNVANQDKKNIVNSLIYWKQQISIIKLLSNWITTTAYLI